MECTNFHGLTWKGGNMKVFKILMVHFLNVCFAL